MISETAGSILLSHRWEIAGGFCVLWCLILLGKAVLHPLHKVPGPLWARFSRLWYLRAVSRGNFERLNIDLHRRHGKSAAFHPPDARPGSLTRRVMSRSNCPDRPWTI